jgi:hypothetical protein
MGVISSRTPEGEPVTCPVCGGMSLVVPSAFPTADAPCPRCGHLPWATGDQAREVEESAAARARAMEESVSRGARLLRELEQHTRPVTAEVQLKVREIMDAAEVRAPESLFTEQAPA